MCGGRFDKMDSLSEMAHGKLVNGHVPFEHDLGFQYSVE